MNQIAWIGIGCAAAVIISLFFEEGREWWEETLTYIISFEWFSDIWEFITGLFEDLGEFSIGGLLFAASSGGFVFLVRDFMLNPFLEHMGGFAAVFWGGATYVATIVVGYLVGKKLLDD